MGVIVELVGAPGAGKTTMIPAVVAAAEAKGLEAHTVVEAARGCAGRTRLGRMLTRISPSGWKRRVLWGVYRLGEIWHLVRFTIRDRRLVTYVVRSQRRRPEGSDSRERRVVYWYLRTIGSYHFLARHLRADEVLIVDEGFVHRSVQLHSSAVEVPSEQAVAEYVGLLPRSDLVVHVEASVDTCRRRVEQRGVWDRLSHRTAEEMDEFVANAHEAVRLTRAEIGRRRWSVLDVDNDADGPEAAQAALRERLGARLGSEPLTVGNG